MSETLSLYLELLKKSVANMLYDDDEDLLAGLMVENPQTGQYQSLTPPLADPTAKFRGQVWPSRAHTMIGIPRLNHLQYCVEYVLQNRIAGDLIETGVWRGGASIFMAGILRAYGETERQLWVADSFEGLPPADFERYPQESKIEFHRYSALAVSLQEVQQNFQRYGLLSAQVRFLQGWFRDTLPTAPMEQLALMRLDGDLYESTMDALNNLYPKLAAGGFVIVDDYGVVDSCTAAVHDFFKTHNLVEPLLTTPYAGAYWQKQT